MLRIIILISLLFLGCESQKVENRNSIFQKFNVQITGKPIIAQSMPHSQNDIQYIGYNGILYNLREHDRSVPFEYYFRWSFPERREKYRTEGDQLEILVDEENQLGIRTYENLPEENPSNISEQQLGAWLDSHIVTVAAFPVYVINRSTKSSSIRFFDGGNSDMIQEAKDKNGNWRPIEYLTYGWCGNGHGDFLIPPDSYYIIAACKYSGDFKTELRVRMQKGDKVYYSNSYKGQINLSQLEMSEKLRKHDEWKKSMENKTWD
jgi:hypothetical protein